MKAWTKYHIMTVSPTCAVMTICAVIIMKSAHAKEFFKKYALKFIALLLIALEVFKQINSFSEGAYRLYSLPFHYCSLFLYLLPLHAFYRGKLKAKINTVTLAISSSLFLMMLIMPGGVYDGDQISAFFTDPLCLHTVVFHSLVCLYLAIALFTGEFSELSRHSLMTVAAFTLFYSVVAGALAYSLETNFHNFYYCIITEFENIRQTLIDSIGAAGQIIYMSAVAFLTVCYSVVSFIPARIVAHTIASRKKDADIKNRGSV